MNSVKHIIRAFGPGERLLFFVLGFACLFSGLYSLVSINNRFLVEVPDKGGSLTEGMIGSPRFINPVLAVSDTDKSLAKLVYAGLLKVDTENGYVGELADTVSVSEDGLIYDIKIKEEAEFHDGRPVTSDDVIFTIEKTLDPIIKSPKRANWEGVTIEKLSDKELHFILKKPYFPFLENLTLGILPKHIWENVTSEEFAFSTHNLEPIGAGPYKIDSVSKNGSGLPTKISLEPFKKYLPEDAYISELNFVFFPNENAALLAFAAGDIEAVGGISGQSAPRLTGTILTNPLPRIFGAFFNQNQAPVLANIEVRRALDAALDKQILTTEILGSYGTPLGGPTPEDAWAPIADTSTIEEARTILENAGWAANDEGVLEKKLRTGIIELKFSISTSDVPDLKRTAEFLRDTWNRLGANVDVKVFSPTDLSQNVIKPREYEVLLFGEVVNRDLDLYPFWHSSERNDPGLNISLYTNIATDKLLDDMRSAKTREERDTKIAAFKAEIEKDVPAVFLYAPHYVYALPPKVKDVSLVPLGNPSDRFSHITSWYIETKNIWSIFVPKESSPE